jgi:hypothetical protein
MSSTAASPSDDAKAIWVYTTMGKILAAWLVKWPENLKEDVLSKEISRLETDEQIENMTQYAQRETIVREGDPSACDSANPYALRP